ASTPILRSSDILSPSQTSSRWCCSSAGSCARVCSLSPPVVTGDYLYALRCLRSLPPWRFVSLVCSLRAMLGRSDTPPHCSPSRCPQDMIPPSTQHVPYAIASCPHAHATS